MNFKNKKIKDGEAHYFFRTCFYLIFAILIFLFSFLIALSFERIAKADEILKEQEKPVENFNNDYPIEELKDELRHKEPEKREWTKEEIKKMIMQLAEKNNLNAQSLLQLSQCESSFNHLAVNTSDPYGGSKGLFQINGIHKLTDECLFNPICNTNWAIKKIKEGQAKIWACTKIKKLKF